MEHKRETDVEDYWLIQYQRLLESKPVTLLEKVRSPLYFDEYQGRYPPPPPPPPTIKMLQES